MKFFAALAFFGLLAAGGAVAQAGLTLEIPATGIGKALALIAGKTGLKLDVAPALAGAVVVVRAEDAPIEDVLRRLADVAGGVWETGSDGVRRLVRDRDRHFREEREDRDERATRIQKALRDLEALAAKAAKPAKEAKPPAEGEAPSEDEVADMGVGFLDSSGGGSFRAWAALARTLNVVELAGLGEKGRIVYATTPNRSQRLLGASVAGPVVAELVQRHNERVAATEAAAKEQGQPVDPMEETMAPMLLAMGLDPNPKRIEAAPAKVLFIVERGSGFGMAFMDDDDSLSLGIKLFDAQGKQLLRATRPLMLGRMAEGLRMAATPQKLPPKPPAEDERFELAAETVELQKLSDFGGMAEGSLLRQPSEALQAKLLRPDLNDPLGFYWSEGLLATARHRKANLVANLPDDISSLMGSEDSDPKPTYGAFWGQIEKNKALKVAVDEAWIVVQPARPHRARLERLDRAALAALLQAAAQKEFPGLDDVATYASKCAPPMSTPIAMPHIMLFASNLLQQGMAPLNWDILRLYGAFGPAQRQALRSGAAIPFSALNPAQAAQVRTLAFGSGARLDVVREGEPAKPAEDEQGWMSMFSRFMPRMGSDFLDEPTEVMPDGLPALGQVSLAVETEPFVAPLDEKGQRHRVFGALGVDEVAMFRAFSEDPNMAAMATGMPKFSQYLVGERDVLDLKLQLGPGVSTGDKMFDHRMGRGGKPIAWEGLPKDFVAQVQKRIEAFKKNPFPFMPGQGESPPP